MTVTKLQAAIIVGVLMFATGLSLVTYKAFDDSIIAAISVWLILVAIALFIAAAEITQKQQKL